MDAKQKFLELLPQHFGYGYLLSQKDLDQGDTSQRIGTVFTLLMIIGDKDLIRQFLSIHPTFEQSYNMLEAEIGIYRRSPNPMFWGYNPNNLSRDQLSVLKMGMAAMDRKERLAAVAIQQYLRMGFHQNVHPGTDAAADDYKVPDIMSPTEMGVYNRGLLGPLSVLPNHIWDLGFFVDLAVRKDDNWDQDNMLALNLLFANWEHPTLWSRLALKAFMKTNFMDRLWNYHKDSDGNNGCEPLYWLFVLAFENMK